MNRTSKTMVALAVTIGAGLGSCGIASAATESPAPAQVPDNND